jgi:hypothetical protein
MRPWELRVAPRAYSHVLVAYAGGVTSSMVSSAPPTSQEQLPVPAAAAEAPIPVPAVPLATAMPNPARSTPPPVVPAFDEGGAALATLYKNTEPIEVATVAGAMHEPGFVLTCSLNQVGTFAIA